MAKMRIDFNRAAIRELMQTDLTSDRGAAIADACNGESSWGGYHVEDASSEIRNRTVVWCEWASPERANRMIRNLDAG